MTCGQHFELSRIVADSSLSMTLCPKCGGHEIQTIGESSREAAPQTATVEQPVPTEPAAAAKPATTALPASSEPEAGETAA
jgi:predicted  nucleic acid-binding Zn-ribbon protein